MAFETHLQQRIVGAIVLVTLGVIFIPALLDGSGYRARQAQEIEVREKPTFNVEAREQPQAVPTPVEQNRQDLAQLHDQDKAQLASQPIRAFALQVGTFESEDNATRLQEKLKAAGYSVYIRPSDPGQSDGYKVRIGPHLDRKELDKIKQDVKQSFAIDGYVVNHP
jgi:DedD protein